jgi:PPOX class probable F420-dependent enzyme
MATLLVMASHIPPDVRALLDGPNYVHLATLRRDGSPRNWVVWSAIEGEHVLICTNTDSLKAKDMMRDPRVALSVADLENPYRMAAVQGRVVDMRNDADNTVMDRIAHKYTSRPFPNRMPNRVCFAIEVERAGQRTLAFEHSTRRRLNAARQETSACQRRRRGAALMRKLLLACRSRVGAPAKCYFRVCTIWPKSRLKSVKNWGVLYRSKCI